MVNIGRLSFTNFVLTDVNDPAITEAAKSVRGNFFMRVWCMLVFYRNKVVSNRRSQVSRV